MILSGKYITKQQNFILCKKGGQNDVQMECVRFSRKYTMLFNYIYFDNLGLFP